MASIVSLIFRGGNKAYNQCSIRKIRNIFVHDVTEYVVKAIVDRKDEMMEDMDDFSNMIRGQFAIRKEIYEKQKDNRFDVIIRILNKRLH